MLQILTTQINKHNQIMKHASSTDHNGKTLTMPQLPNKTKINHDLFLLFFLGGGIFTEPLKGHWQKNKNDDFRVRTRNYGVLTRNFNAQEKLSHAHEKFSRAHEKLWRAHEKHLHVSVLTRNIFELRLYSFRLSHFCHLTKKKTRACMCMN